MKIFAIDPGPVFSAWVVIDRETEEVEAFGKAENELFVKKIAAGFMFDEALIEYPKPRGQPLYYQLVDTIRWIGRFEQAAGRPLTQVDRKDVKMALCRSTKATDANIRAALISRYFERSAPEALGGGSEPVIGKKSNPGPLYGLTSDVWAALAVAISWIELENERFKYAMS